MNFTMNHDGATDEDWTLLSKLLDETISEAEFEQLQARFADQPGLRSLYRQLIDQEIELSLEPTGSVVTPSRDMSNATKWLMGAVVLSALGILLFGLLYPGSPSPNPAPSPPSPDAGPAVVAKGKGQPVPQPRPRRIPDGPEAWMVDFEDGLPEGWEARFVDTDLPKGSKGAAGTLATADKSGAHRYIQPPRSWSPGQVRVGSNTHLHLDLKVDRNAPFTIFLFTHVPDPSRKDVGMYVLGSELLPKLYPGWQEVSIPFSLFRRKETRGKVDVLVPAGPKPGEVVWQMLLDGPNAELDIVVDAWRVNQVGPGTLQVREIR